MELLISILVSIFVGFLIMEAYAWGPRISEWLVERAVRRLHTEDQESCRAEWRADLACLPNSAVQLIWAFDCLRAATQINTNIFQEKFDQVDSLLGELSKRLAVNKQKFQVLKLALEDQDDKASRLKHTLNDLAACATTTIGTPIANVDVVQKLAKSCDEYRHTMTGAVNRASDLLHVRFQELNAMIDQADALVQKIVEKRSHAIQLRGQQKLASATAPVFESLTDNLAKLRIVVEYLDGDGDDKHQIWLKEIHGITAAIGDSAISLRKSALAIAPPSTIAVVKSNLPRSGAV
jgi:hypothetical protein